MRIRKRLIIGACVAFLVAYSAIYALHKCGLQICLQGRGGQLFGVEHVYYVGDAGPHGGTWTQYQYDEIHFGLFKITGYVDKRLVGPVARAR
jgi:hypothetical protein